MRKLMFLFAVICYAATFAQNAPPADPAEAVGAVADEVQAVRPVSPTVQSVAPAAEPIKAVKTDGTVADNVQTVQPTAPTAGPIEAVETNGTVADDVQTVRPAATAVQPTAPPAAPTAQPVAQPTIAPAAASTNGLPRIAVYVTGNVGEDEKSAFGTTMLSTLINSGRYRGIERSASFIAEIEREHLTQRSGAIDDSQISALGRQFGVKYVCVAAITPAFGSYQVSGRIIDVESAEVIFIGEAFSHLQTPGDFSQVAGEVVKKMFGEQPKAEPPPAPAHGLAAAEARSLSRLKLAIRIPTSLLAIGGIVGGVMFDGEVKSETARYRNFGTPSNPKGTDAEDYAKVQEMRENIDNNIIIRNLLYGLAGIGLAGFSVTLFF